MSSSGAPVLNLQFSAQLIEWRGPAPFLFAPIPDEHYAELRFAAREASYGWGVVPVIAVIGATQFTTSLIPRDGTFLLPIKVAVQRAEHIGPGSLVDAILIINAPSR